MFNSGRFKFIFWKIVQMYNKVIIISSLIKSDNMHKDLSKTK